MVYIRDFNRLETGFEIKLWIFFPWEYMTTYQTNAVMSTTNQSDI